MTNIPKVQNPTGKVAEMLDGVKKKLGMVPNLMATMAQSPAVLESYLAFSGAMNHSSLSPQLREKIAITVGQENSCDYCLAAHTKLGSLAGISEADLKASRTAKSPDAKEQVALQFADNLVKNRGRATKDEIEGLRKVGYNDGAITEIVASVALNIFTNYFNHVADTEVDFPKVV